MNDPNLLHAPKPKPEPDSEPMTWDFRSIAVEYASSRPASETEHATVALVAVLLSIDSRLETVALNARAVNEKLDAMFWKCTECGALTHVFTHACTKCNVLQPQYRFPTGDQE